MVSVILIVNLKIVNLSWMRPKILVLFLILKFRKFGGLWKIALQSNRIMQNKTPKIRQTKNYTNFFGKIIFEKLEKIKL